MSTPMIMTLSKRLAERLAQEDDAVGYVHRLLYAALAIDGDPEEDLQADREARHATRDFQERDWSGI